MIVPSVSFSTVSQRLVLVGHDVVRVLAQGLQALDVRVDRAAEDRPRAHDRDLDRQVLQRLRPRPQQRRHLRPRLDLEDAHRVRDLDRVVGRLVVVRDPRQVHPRPAHAPDLLHAALDRRQHPQPEQVDLQEARVRARVLVPLAELAALHRRRQHRAAVDQRPRRDDHPARVLGEMPRQPVGLVAQPRQPRPAPGQAVVGGRRRVGLVRLGLVRPLAVDHRQPLRSCSSRTRSRARRDR